MNSENAYIVFTDLKGFSKLSPKEIEVFYQHLLPDLAESIGQYQKKADVWNTWGDAVVAIFKDAKTTVDFVLAYRDFFIQYDYTGHGISELRSRISGHFGQFDLYQDPLLDGRNNALGEHINTSARIEPITRPNEIYVTEAFKAAIESAPCRDQLQVEFYKLGALPLAKDFGSKDLYRLRKSSETRSRTQIIDRILEQDLSAMLPERPKMSSQEKKAIDAGKSCLNADALKVTLQLESILDEEETSHTENFLIAAAELCKEFGLYPNAIKLINKVKQQKSQIDGIEIALAKHSLDLMKLEANCRTRLGQYEEAADLVYGVWQMGHKDSDTLSMLAAQYKRRALFSPEGRLLTANAINNELVNRALSLYTEAFRLNIDDYYPAINIAYLYKMFGKDKKGRGNKFASFILDTWEREQDQNWWLKASLLECEIILDDFEGLEQKFRDAIEEFNPGSFDKKATATQIRLYMHFVDLDDELTAILQRILQQLE